MKQNLELIDSDENSEYDHKVKKKTSLCFSIEGVLEFFSNTQIYARWLRYSTYSLITYSKELLWADQNFSVTSVQNKQRFKIPIDI